MYKVSNSFLLGREYRYSAPGHGERVNYYSNPDVNFNDYPTGTINDDNARVFTHNRFDQAARGDESGTCGSTTTTGVDGVWGTWSVYGACSTTCGSGQKTRTRSCDSPAPSGDGAACSGLSTGTASCNTDVICSVDGAWGTWSAYGACSTTCGGGQKTRTRTCNNPAPSGSGAACSGPSSATAPCNTDVTCPVEGKININLPGGDQLTETAGLAYGWF